MKLLFKFVVLILLVNCLNFVSGFGVSISYSMQDPLMIYPGQSTDVLVSLQSLIDEGDLVVVPEISQGQEIIEITDSLREYKIISNQPVGAEVHLKVSIPNEVSIGTEYPIKLKFRDITEKEGGVVGFSSSIEASFNVLVVKKPTEIMTSEQIRIGWIILIILLVFVVLVVIAIVWFLIKKKK